MMKLERKAPRAVKVGTVLVGGGFPVSVQTMGKQPLTTDMEVLRLEMRELHRRGCDILRFSVPDEESARCFSLLTKDSPMPLVADIHFDYKLALFCIKGGAAKIRINPGNIGASWKVEEVVKAAADRGIPIRVGVNGGSLPGDLRSRTDKAEAMVEAAERELTILDKLDFHQVIFSLKASDIEATIKANEIFASKYSYPLHLGVTEAGPLIPGIVKSTLAFQRLLSQNIGDTIRVSLSDAPAKEVEAGKEILRSLGKKTGGVNLVSCPRCGRSTFDTHAFLDQAESYLQGLKKNITVAVMGCVVNGPGEARGADIGITGAGDAVIIYRKGELIAKVPRERALERFIEEIEKL
jgi:(E)-4-hydroxy-3-methylbut-2-enyl-diphosphate synthase